MNETINILGYKLTIQLVILILAGILIVLYAIFKLILILRKVRRQRAELKKLVTEYEEFLRNRKVNN